MRIPKPKRWYSSPSPAAPVPAGSAADLPELLLARGSHIVLGKKGTVDVPVGTCSVSSGEISDGLIAVGLLGFVEGASFSWGWVAEMYSVARTEEMAQ